MLYITVGKYAAALLIRHNSINNQDKQNYTYMVIYDPELEVQYFVYSTSPFYESVRACLVFYIRT
jgi:hypothetical protein